MRLLFYPADPLRRPPTPSANVHGKFFGGVVLFAALIQPTCGLSEAAFLETDRESGVFIAHERDN